MSGPVQVLTARGEAEIVRVARGRHGVFLKQGNTFLGSVFEEYEGTHVAYPADHRTACRHDTTRAAALWLGEKV